MFPLLVDNLKSEDYFYAQKRNMKKKTVLKLLFITSCLVAVCSLFYNNETSTLDSLAFQNVEALAQGEMMMMPIAMVMVQSIAEATK